MLIELGFFLYEAYLRFRYRDLEALEVRTLKARDAFDQGQPRRAYRYLQENNYSVVVARFLFDLIRNYQTQRLPEKPLKLLQEYEFYTVKRLERTRILVRVGPLLGLMGTLIPLAPALQALADGDTQKLADNLTVAFSVTVLGLLIGGLAFMISIIRDRFYSQDISDLEYLLELLEGGAAALRVGRPRRRKGEFETFDDDLPDEAECRDQPGAPGTTPERRAASPLSTAGPRAGDRRRRPAPFVRPIPGYRVRRRRNPTPDEWRPTRRIPHPATDAPVQRCGRTEPAPGGHAIRSRTGTGQPDRRDEQSAMSPQVQKSDVSYPPTVHPESAGGSACATCAGGGGTQTATATHSTASSTSGTSLWCSPSRSCLRR